MTTTTTTNWVWILQIIMIETLSEEKEVGVKLLRNDLHNYQQEF